MNAARLSAITGQYSRLQIAIVGDFCLDRYLEIDPARTEARSSETGLDVYNVVRVRSQPGGAGTILNNLAALGVGEISPIGFCGSDGEGWELRGTAARGRVKVEHFLTAADRRTFTYCKPLVLEPGQPPRRGIGLILRIGHRRPQIAERSGDTSHAICARLEAIILLDQVDVAETGVATTAVAAPCIRPRRPSTISCVGR